MLHPFKMFYCFNWQGKRDPKGKCCIIGYLLNTSTTYIFNSPELTFAQLGTPDIS